MNSGGVTINSVLLNIAILDYENCGSIKYIFAEPTKEPEAPRALPSVSPTLSSIFKKGKRGSLISMGSPNNPSWDSSLVFQFGPRLGSSSCHPRSSPMSTAYPFSYNLSALLHTGHRLESPAPSAFSARPSQDTYQARYYGECPRTGCEKKFISRSQWIRHERMHTGEKAFVCPEAGCMEGMDAMQWARG
jgi:hypothetical protein